MENYPYFATVDLLPGDVKLGAYLLYYLPKDNEYEDWMTTVDIPKESVVGVRSTHFIGNVSIDRSGFTLTAGEISFIPTKSTSFNCVVVYDWATENLYGIIKLTPTTILPGTTVTVTWNAYGIVNYNYPAYKHMQLLNTKQKELKETVRRSNPFNQTIRTQ